MEVNIMKKLLSVLLAVMMLFGTVAMSASAADFDMSYTDASSILISKTGMGVDDTFGRVEGDWVLIYFNAGGFTTNSMIKIFDAQNSAVTTVQNPGFTGNFWFIPDSVTSTYYIGGKVTLPRMLGNEIQSFEGWRCVATKDSYVAGEPANITADMVNDYGVVEFEPIAGYAQAEEDTMGTILGILIKVFGSIVGLLFCNGDPVAGQEMVAGLLGGIVG